MKNEYKKLCSDIQGKINSLKNNKKKQTNKSDISVLEKRLEWIKEEREMKIASIDADAVLRKLYKKRNDAIIKNLEHRLEIDKAKLLAELKITQTNELANKYDRDIDNELAVLKQDIQKQYNEQESIKIQNETIVRYEIYFAPNDSQTTYKHLVEDMGKDMDSFSYLIYDNRAEKAKIDRQSKALESIKSGYVKNPYLPSYLFAPETLKQSQGEEIDDIEWCLDGELNDRQQEAVKKALASDSIFLLQGPPGTGKTQVIAELTAQYIKQGKKVLISSETHKAIDNVFDRLPKIPNIRPIRLIPSNNGKKTNYSPEKLVDNLYCNIYKNIEKEVNRFTNFEETKLDFDDNIKELKCDYGRLLVLKNRATEVQNKIKKLRDSNIALSNDIAIQEKLLLQNKESLREYNDTISAIQHCDFDQENGIEQYLARYQQEVLVIFSKFSCLKDVSVDKLPAIKSVQISMLKQEIDNLLQEDGLAKLETERKNIRQSMEDLRDENGDNPQEGTENYSEFKQLQGKLIDINKRINELKEKSNFDISDIWINKNIPSIINDKQSLKQVVDQIKRCKLDLQECENNIVKSIKIDIEREDKQVEINKEINILMQKKNANDDEINALREDECLQECEQLDRKLQSKINKFFYDFNITEQYNPKDLSLAFSIMQNELSKLEQEYDNPAINEKIEIYKQMASYINPENKQLIESDRIKYTRELLKCANVFGITCTSRDKYSTAQLEELGKYGIQSIDIKHEDIDVVIVDEVSKSSFLDLLIPILYGKTVILVGDHRQLPPMYDLRHMKENEFSGLDSAYITYEQNKKYTTMYEECFFKTLYEKANSDFKIMLNKQYRCHSDIMKCFNHFYNGSNEDNDGLKIGKKQLDNEKQHNLKLIINRKPIISPNNHVCFVNCREYESSDEGSTSISNKQESEVAIRLLQGLSECAKSQSDNDRPSVGVICTYGDQASCIKKMKKGKKLDGFSTKDDEKLIISTVDDFQGDERDIIILSMVRNPRNPNKTKSNFIAQFQRINVALSRARKLLIVLGSRDFLDSRVIDLPDVSGNHHLDKTNYPVYKEIIKTIEQQGAIWDAKDILGEKDAK